MGIVNYVRNGRRFGDRKMLTGAKIPKMSLQAYDSTAPGGRPRPAAPSRVESRCMVASPATDVDAASLHWHLLEVAKGLRVSKWERSKQ